MCFCKWFRKVRVYSYMRRYEIVYSNRMDWTDQKNHISQILEQKTYSGEEIIDLTESNPTKVNIPYPNNEIAQALTSTESAAYEPDSRGLISAREAIVEYYNGHAISLNVDQIITTSSTSEAYSYLFRLLTDPGDSILVPQPCYPLFPYLSSLECVKVKYYRLFYENHRWHMDLSSIKEGISPSTRAILVVNPNNPTGNFLKQNEIAALRGICHHHNLPLIIDEVFLDYDLGLSEKRGQTLDDDSQVLTFVLSGLSKVSGLPQMKLSWIVVHGPEDVRQHAINQLALLADMYLSVSVPIQYAASTFLRLRTKIQPLVKARIKKNLNTANEILRGTVANILSVEGGWYGIIHFPEDQSDEDWVCQILQCCDVLFHPGYLYDFQEEAFAVFSLLTKPNVFRKGIQRLKALLTRI